MKNIHYFTKRELALIDVSCYQLLETLSITHEHWAEVEALRKSNFKDIKTLKDIRQKIKISGVR